jgi:hypothetical protein
MSDYVWLSPSQMKSTCTCPLQQYYKRVLEWDDPSNFNLITGIIGHDIAEEGQRLKCLGCSPWDEAKTHQRVEHWFNYEIAKAEEKGGIRLSRKERDLDWDSLCDYHLSKCKEYGWIYIKDCLPDVFPKLDENLKPMIEYDIDGRLEYHFKDGLKVKVTGRIDTVDKRDIIIDQKNIGNKPSVKEVRNSIQYKIYGVWFKRHYGYYPKIRQDSIVKVKKPYYEATEGYIMK